MSDKKRLRRSQHFENSKESGDNSVERKRLVVSGVKVKIFNKYFRTRLRKVQRIHIESSKESGDNSVEGKRLVSGVKTLRGQTLTANNITVCQSTGGTVTPIVMILFMMIIIIMMARYEVWPVVMILVVMAMVIILDMKI